MTLVEEIVGTQEPDVFPNSYANLLKSTGFKSAAGACEYTHISIEAIEAYLEKELRKKHSGEVLWDSDYGEHNSDASQYSYIHCFRIGADSDKNRKIWLETELGNYVGKPPVHVLNALKRAIETKQFDRFVVAEIKDKIDPLLIGYIGKQRFLIDYWDNDIDPTELVKK